MPSNADLWQRFETFDLDGEAGRAFSHRIARTLSLTPAQAENALTEYRRFLYLASISLMRPRIFGPLDKILRLHVASPRDAWTRFTAELAPSGNTFRNLTLSERNQRDVLAYAQLRDLYAREFASTPPSEFWPEPPALPPSFSDSQLARKRAESMAMLWSGLTLALPLMALMMKAPLVSLALGSVCALIALRFMRQAAMMKSRRFRFMAPRRRAAI